MKGEEEQFVEYSDFLEPASAQCASVCGSSASVCRSAEYSDSVMADEQDLFAAEPASAHCASVCGSSASVCRSTDSLMADEQDSFDAGKKGLVGLHKMLLEEVRKGKARIRWRCRVVN